uniref:Proteasome-associated protein ECM29-like protein n=4 Tax=Parascaris TaxID=6254 RepID=A0A915BK96_PARUN
MFFDRYFRCSYPGLIECISGAHIRKSTMAEGGSDSEACSQLERLFLRLASLNDDAKLEQFARASLLEIIRLLSSGGSPTRSKGIELLSHFNRRIRGNTDIALPFDDLVAYLSSDSSQRNIIATNFAMVYLKMAVNRLNEDDRIRALPLLFNALRANMADKNVVDQIVLLTIGGWMRISQLNSEKWPNLKELIDAPIRAHILQFFTDVLAFPYPLGKLEAHVAAVEARQVNNLSCISVNTYLRIAKDLFMSTSFSITAAKVAIVKVLSSGYFNDMDVLPLLTIGVANGCDEVEFVAESAMRKIDIGEAVKERQVVDKLYSLYLGNASKEIPRDEQLPCASVQLKLRILPLLIRSNLAATTFPLNIKVAFDGLFGGVSMPQPQKLQQLAAEFLLLLVRNCPSNFLPTFGPIIFSSLRKLINNCEYTNVVAIAYQCFGLIGRNVPKLITKDMALLQETFDAIPSAPDDIAAAIVDCLITWLPTFCSLNDAAISGVLQTLISSYLQHDSGKCRLVALKYVEALVRSPAVEFRWMLCQACGDARDEMHREARRLLELSISDQQFMPPFEEMAQYLHKKLKLDREPAKVVETGPDGVKKKKEMFADEVFRISAEYLFACACVASGHSATLRSENDDSNAEIFADVYSFVKSIGEKHEEAIDAFVEIVLEAIESHPSTNLLEVAIILLHSNGGRIKELSRERVLAMLRQYLNSSARANICSSVANLLVIALSDSERRTLLDEQLPILQDYTNVMPSAGWLCAHITCLRSDWMNAKRIAEVHQQFARMICAMSAQPSALLESSCAAFCESLRRSPLALNCDRLAELYRLRSEEGLDDLIEQLGKLSVSRKDTVTSKMKEAAVGCIGFLSSVDFPELYEKLVGKLFAVGEGAPQAELQFSVGDALVDAAFGEYSPSRRNVFTESVKIFLEANKGRRRDVIEQRMASLLESLIGTKLMHTNRHLRQSALIWLFVLTKRGSTADLDSVSRQLSRIQLAFINALAESNEFSQDIASKGLGVVFELANEEQKKAMMSELVNALSSGRRMVTPVTADTPIFEKGELGEAPTGGSLTTYQELCSLATDLNQPELMYKFLQLANHNAMWNSKKGAAFGFSVVMQQARTEFEPYLAQLVPKLFRYRYDPDFKVQHSMRTIWETLTSTKKNVVEEYAEQIFSELLSTLTNHLWRVRESSCLALSDLLSSNSTSNMHRRFGELFEKLFRVQDDVKESVRLAANRALSSLTKVCIRECSSNRGPKATELIGVILPALLEKGMRSVVKANRMFSLKAVMDLSKEAGMALRPHLVIVVPCLLESLSEVEPAVLNYLAARSDNEELEALDSARASAARTSPMMSTLHDVIPLVNDEVLPQLATPLCEMLRASVGLATRTGACQFVINLCLRRQQTLMASKSTCDKLMHALFSGLRDRNPTVRKQFSSAVSYLLKFCSSGQIDALLKFVREKMEGDQEEDKMTALHVLRALSTNSNEFLAGCASSLLPYIFLSTCQQVEKGDEIAKKKVEMWEELWSEMVAETSSAIRLYRKDMMEVAVGALKNNPVWLIKAQAATMLSRVVEVVSEDIDPSEADEIYTTLTSMLSGRLWDGKVKVIQAIITLLQSTGEKLAAEWAKTSTVQQKFIPLWKECKKKDRVYSAEAMRCASIFCEKTHSMQDASELFALIKHVIGFQGQRVESDDSESESVDNAAKTVARNTYLASVLSALPHTLLAFDHEKLLEGVEVMCWMLNSSTVYWKVKQALVVEFPYLLERWRCKAVIDMSAIFIAIAGLVSENASQRRTFAQQCCGVLERIADGALSGRWQLVADRLVHLISELMDIEVVKSSLTFQPLLQRLIKQTQ